MLFHIPKQSNLGRVCFVIDFFASFFSDEVGEFENFVLGQRNNYIFINVWVYRGESWSKNFQYMVEKSFEIVIFY